ncbi:MAG: pitrilysin family protein, partial [Ginsengibacter sp.]
MKNIVCFILVCSIIGNTTNAQSKSEKFSVDGITVLMRPTVKDIIDVSVYYRDGVADYGADKAGLANLAVSATTQCGTKDYSKDAFKDRADKYGISIYGFSTYDYSAINLNCISKYFDEGWSLLTAAVKNPIYDEKEFALLKEKSISGIKNQESNPDSKLQKMAIQNTFKGTVYETDPQGDTGTVNNITAEEAKDFYYNTLLNKNKIFIVVAGKISKEDITARIKKAFSDMPSRPYKAPVYQTPEITANSLHVEPRTLATNYIMGVMNAPSYTSPDYVANRVAFATFSDNLFIEIRTKRNLSYAPYAYSVSNKMPYSIMYVSTTDPKASVEVMDNEINRLKKDGFSQKEFTESKNLYITANYMKEESTSALASSLGNAEILGDWKMSDEFINKVQKLTPADMTKSFSKYIKGINWNYLGDEKAADAAKE